MTDTAPEETPPEETPPEETPKEKPSPKKPSKWPQILVMLLVLAISLWGGWLIWKNPQYRPVVINVYGPPQLLAEPMVMEMGKIQTDAEAKRTFYLSNVGGRLLHIDRVETSCGCTLAKLADKDIAPGEVTTLEVKLDTSLKLGPVQKRVSVLSNDPKTPRLDLKLVGTVLPQMKGHEKIPVKDPLVLFKGQCATCHVMKGKGKSGKALFQADCGMCHGLNGQGSVAPNLLAKNYQDPKILEAARQTIALGSPANPEMPPFSTEKGGPLNEAEIDSLIRFLVYQSRLYQQNLLDENGFPKTDTQED